MEQSEPFYKDGLCFSCTQCSHCCKDTPGVVLLSEDDLDRLASWAQVTPEQFQLMYCRWVEFDDGTEYLSLREKRNYDCIFWEDGGCSAYDARPVQCRTFPFWTHILRDREAWDNRAKECPGINQGELRSKEEIEEQLNQYKKRNAIHRTWRIT